jgi:hypothetical protein
MFSLNWETLREHAAVTARTTASERDALAEELAALRDGEAQAPRSPGAPSGVGSRCESVVADSRSLARFALLARCSASSRDGARADERPYAEPRARMVREQLVARGIRDARVLEAMGACRATSSCPSDARRDAYETARCRSARARRSRSPTSSRR